VGEVLPGATDTLHLGLATELSFGAHLASHSGDLVGEARELVDHRVHGRTDAKELALDGLALIPEERRLGDGCRHLRDVAQLAGNVGVHVVHRVGEVLPRPRYALHTRLTTELSFGADLAGDSGDLVGEARELVDHRVHGRTDAKELALDGLAL